MSAAFKKVEGLNSKTEFYPAKISGCTAADFQGGADGLTLEVNVSPQRPVLLVLANRDFYHHPCKLEASIPAVSAEASKSAVVFVGGWGASLAAAPPTVIDIRNPGRTSLAAGPYEARLDPKSRSEVKYYTITLTSARVVDAIPPSFPARLSGCLGSAAEAAGQFLGSEGRILVRPDGSLQLELLSRTQPECRAVASVLALPSSGR